MRTFTIDEAREKLPDVIAACERLVPLRAELTEALHARQQGDDRRPLADLKGLEAAVAEIVDGLAADGLQVKGYAPLLVDFPMAHEGRVLLLCWLEGERSLDWYHDADLGFAGRRPLTDLDPA